MATFIPEWVKLCARSVQIKRILNALDDEHVVRRPIRPDACCADLFVQHRAKGWLAIAVEEQPFADLGVSTLFDDERRLRFERRLADLQALLGDSTRSGERVEALVLMWSCSTDEVRALSKTYLARFGTRLIARETFAHLGTRLVGGLLEPLTPTVEQQLMGRFFPEAEIPAACLTRRLYHRDNSATLARHFLDRDQEWASKLDLDLPDEQAGAARDFSVRLVNGVAGSGKTLIALSRARLLAELFPSQAVLLLIHNTPIVADINDRLHRSGAAAPRNLEVTTFFAWASRQWRAVFQRAPRMPEDPRAVPKLIRHHRHRLAPQLGLPEERLADELDFINESLILDEAGYLEASRAGRRFALRARERTQIWALYTAVTKALARDGQMMWSELPRQLALAPASAGAPQSYRHVLVDEAQFFAPSWFELVKRAVQPEGQLFLCADPNQGFMRSRLSWKRVGLEVAGRTRKLRRSYRTTRALLEAANGVLGQLGSSDADDFLQPDFAGMEDGSQPMLVYVDSPHDAVDRLVNELSDLFDSGAVPLNSALVIYGERVHKVGLHERLRRRFGNNRVWWFNAKEQKREPPGGYGHDRLRMAYLDTATGLEAGIVFLVGIEHLYSDGATLDPERADDTERHEENARKLYMAMTRASQRLVLLSSERLPKAIERLFLLADG